MDYDLDLALDTAAEHLAVRISGGRKYGWNCKSAGVAVDAKGGLRRWLRVQYAEPDRATGRLWDGELAANEIEGVKKPYVFDHCDWTAAGRVWRATLMTLAESPVCSETQEARGTVKVTSDWFRDLRDSLATLEFVRTDRTCCRQDLISRRIAELYGSAIDSTVSEWVTCHGDIHWANLTSPQMMILDWEVWGKGPRGLDAAFLLAFSALQPELAKCVKETFDDWLTTRDGQLAQLFACAELQRMIELRGDHPELMEPLERLGNSVYAELVGAHG